MNHINCLMMIKWSTNVHLIIRREMSQVITHSPISCVQDNGENRLHLRHTLDRTYLKSSLCVQHFQVILHKKDDNNKVCPREYDHSDFCGALLHHGLWSTLVQITACWLTAPSINWTDGELSSMKNCAIHLKAIIILEMIMKVTNTMHFNITHL